MKTLASNSKTSNSILFFFVLILGLGALSSEFFQAPHVENQELNRYRLLFSEKTLDNLQELTLKNRLGTFQFMKKESVTDNNYWELVSPRNIPANSQQLTKIINSLRGIKIRKVLSKDAINLSNFSLDTPLFNISFKNKNQKVSSELSVGLVNPIDNSTYVMLDDKEAIYHVDALSNSLEKLALNDFIDGRIIALAEDQISSVTIYRGTKSSSRVQLMVEKEDKKWTGKSKRSLETKKVQEYLGALTQLKSQLILDSMSNKLSDKIQEYLSKPLYTIDIMDNKNNTITYILSHIVSTLPDVKINKRQSYIINASNRPHPYLANKDSLKVFNLRENKLRGPSIKKLFY